LAEDCLSSPRWFPDRLDWHNRLVRLVPVRLETLRKSAFLDGRTPLHDPREAPQVVDLETFIAAHSRESPPDVGWIFHESFCGSTQLARILTVDGEALCLREPQILTDLASWRAALAADDETLFAATLRASVASLSQPWADSERIAIKPSNWANTIAAELLAVSRTPRAAYLKIAAEPFLVAVLRGGAERVRYVLNLHMHLAAARPALRAAIAAYLDPAQDEATSLMRHLAATHWMQRQLLGEIDAAAGSAAGFARLAFPGWLTDPLGGARAAGQALTLGISPDRLARSAASQAARHSKTRGDAYEAAREEQENTAIRASQGAAIADALGALEPFMSAERIAP
jgi:hypothetical protein